MTEFSKYHTSWKIIFEPVTGNVVISEVDAVMYVVLSKAEKHVPKGELVGTVPQKCVTLWPRCCPNRGRRNRAQLHVWSGNTDHTSYTRAQHKLAY